MAANINNISEKDFEVLATAANAARDSGDMTAALALDKLARKANAALTNAKYASLRTFGGGLRQTWQNTPSTLM